MSISMNNINSEVVRAHTRIDGLGTGTMGFPDYSKRQRISVNFIAPSNGFVQGVMNNDDLGNYAIMIDGIEGVRFRTSNGYRHSGSLMCAIAKGSTVTQCNFANNYFIPAKTL